MRPFILALLAALALGAPPPGLADTASDDVVRLVTEELRQREGRAPTDEELVGALNVRTVALLHAGRFADAEPVARVALERGERALGAEHPDTLQSLNNLAGLYDAQRRYGEAEPLYRRALAAREQVQEALIARLARTSPDPRVRDLASRLAQARTDFSQLANLPNPHPNAYAESLAALERLEVELATLNGTFGGQREARGLDWKAVRKALPQGSALLELRAFRRFDFKTDKWSDPRWLALLIPADPGDGPPLRVFDLGPTAASNPLLARLRDGDATAEPLVYQALFGPLDAAIKDYQTLVLTPDGDLDLVASARLRLPDGRYWVQRQALRELRTGRDLLSVPPERVGTGMLALGEIDYDHYPTARTTRAPVKVSKAPPAKHLKSTLAASAEPSPSGSQPGPESGSAPGPTDPATLRLRDAQGRFAPLAYTGPEARRIARFYWDKDHPEGLVLTGLDANERRLKSLADPPRALHLATHGFFLAEQADAPAGGWERPMLLSGIALAGANRGLEGKEGPDGENGILSALEVLDLNLEGTELVTLSACDTGKGAVDRSEGVYGLVRGFQTAGARTVLMTLWPLNDPLARAFMEDFYQNWLDPQGQRSPAEALRKTQIDWIGDSDTRKRDPKYWAPFVLVERG